MTLAKEIIRWVLIYLAIGYFFLVGARAWDLHNGISKDDMAVTGAIFWLLWPVVTLVGIGWAVKIIFIDIIPTFVAKVFFGRIIDRAKTWRWMKSD